MPHGGLTSLGWQLRLVLASIRPKHHVYSWDSSCLSTEGWRPSGDCPLRNTWKRLYRAPGRQQYHPSSRGQAAAATAISPALLDFDDASPKEPTFSVEYDTSTTAFGSNRWRRRRRSDRLTEAYADIGMQYAKPRQNPRKIDLSHHNVKSRAGRLQYRANAKRHVSDSLTPLSQATELSLERLTASCIRHRGLQEANSTPTWDVPFELSQSESAFLPKQGYKVSDVHTWADVLSAKNPYAAATMLADLNTSSKQIVPLFVLSNLLRRQHLNARALRILIEQAWIMMERRATPPDSFVFTVFVRLLRHLREVWPAAMSSITELLLAYLPNGAGKSDERLAKHLESMTYFLNKAMHLLSLPTAVEPYEDAIHQQMAIVRILRYMSGHSTSLQINREGYRAVVRVQLAQGKTTEERHWAELKALSWPPWKQERTAVDALVTYKSHGVSRAAETLRQMREAGYSPHKWEKAARLYTGWDVDGTPTIQTRVSLGSGSFYNKDVAIWVARIATTRTVQEAWAAYLAFDDAKLEHSDAVCLAVFEKLYEEERRVRIELSRTTEQPYRHTKRRPSVLPGDAREVEPLPPSTHLYTYTRTEPPNVEGFFRQLSQRGLQVSGRCLAFIVQNATSLQLGLEYLRGAPVPIANNDPSRVGTMEPQHGGQYLLEAYVRLLCRYSNVPLNKVDDQVSHTFNFFPPVLVMDKLRLNNNHPIVRALSILDAHRPMHRPVWDLVLQALSRDATLSSMRFITAEHHKMPDIDKLDERLRIHGALLSYRLVRRVLHILQEMHLDLDITGFHSLCLVVEKMTCGCWEILKHDVQKSSRRYMDSETRTGPIHDASALLRSTHHVRRLKGLFGILVAGDETIALPSDPDDAVPQPAPSTVSIANLPPLLVTPSPALLHAYIRALGWMADYDGLLETVRWMLRYRTELEIQRARERNGDHTMKLAIVALRVFLERHWLEGVGGERDVPFASEATPVKASDPRARNLRRLEMGAPSETVEQVRELVEGVEKWQGWPTEREMDTYCSQARFVQIKKMYTP